MQSIDKNKILRNFTKEAKHLYTQNCQTLMKEIKQYTGVYVDGQEEFILLKCTYDPKQPMDWM